MSEFNADLQGLTNPRLAPGSPEGFFFTKSSSFCQEKGYVNVVADVHAPSAVHQNMVHEGTTRMVFWTSDFFVIEKWLKQKFLLQSFGKKRLKESF